MAFNHSLRHRTLRASDLLAFYDGVFAVAITTLAASIPSILGAMGDIRQLLAAMLTYSLVAATIGLYWFKMRRLIVIDRHIQPPQLLLAGLALTTVVLVPKMGGLVLRHGVGMGNLWMWSYAQVVNTLCLSLLLLLNLLCLLYAISLRQRRAHLGRHRTLLHGIVNTQLLSFAANLLLLGLELSFTWFDNQYLFLIPLFLIVEEVIVVRGLLR
jgi:uncharacterized membrane protein